MNDVMFRYVLLLFFMAVDIISGIVFSITHDKELKSSIMRNGLFKKVGVICVLCMSDGLQVISARYLGETINITMYVFIYVIMMESLSICENVADKNVTEIVRHFFKLDKEG